MPKILINIPDDLLEMVDRKSREEHLNRSEATRQALLQWLRAPKYIPPKDRPGFAELEARMIRAARTNITSEPAEVLIRRGRDNH